MLLKLIEDVSSWAELESRLANLPTVNEKGEAFEQFCKAFFLLHPVYQFDKVYRQSEIPPSFRNHLGYPGVQDIGIDGLAVTADEKLFAYQAKFRTDRCKTPTLRELSTFFTMSDKADWRITITNANRLPSSINDRIRHSRVLSDLFDGLNSDFFKRLRLYLQKQTITPSEKKTPNKTQQEAIDSALAYFQENTRGQLILPCGIGKTLVSMWIAEKFGGKRILVIVPSLALMSQTLREWASNTSIKPFRYLCLCSDSTVDLGNDSPIEHLYEMNIPVTTKVESVEDFLKNTQTSTLILFSTYQSSKVLSEACIKTGIQFDTGIFDEAHRTTGTKVGVWNLALDDNNVPIRKRVFMTATPRIYAPHITKKAKEEDILICSMDNTALYGNPFYEMTFGEAITRGHITDYKIVIICVTDSEVKKLVQRGGKIITEDGHELDAKALAKRVALIKGINKYGLKKIFTFHSRVKGAKAFTDMTTPYNINKVSQMINPIQNKEIKLFHVNGTMSAGKRNGYMQEFKETEIGIMSNARCLSEGVDIPIVDTVSFMDPKKSLIDIVQATGRAMRTAKWKDKGYIFIPVVIEEGDSPEQFIESSDFDAVWQVVQTIIDQDQRLEDIVSHMRIMQGKGEEGTQKWRDAINEYGETVEFYNLPTKISQSRFINTLHAKTVEIVGKKWDFWYGLTLAHKKQFGNSNASKRYISPEGFNLGQWQAGQRRDYKQNKLSPNQISLLEEIGFIWGSRDVYVLEAFERGVLETVKYKSQFGKPNAPSGYKTAEGYNLGNWQNRQINSYNDGTLSPDRIRMLEEIELIQLRNSEGFQETIAFKMRTGYANAFQGYKTRDGFDLVTWQEKQRNLYEKGELSQERIKQLEEEGFKWDPVEADFEVGFQETIKFKKRMGYANAFQGYKTRDGFDLMTWQEYHRYLYKRGTLSPDKIKMLEEVGFKWDSDDADFEVGFQETIKYMLRTGIPSASRDHLTAEDYKLGAWQRKQITLYKKGMLAPHKVKMFEEINFKWETWG